MSPDQCIDIKPFVDSLGIDLPPVEAFWRLGDLTGLRQDEKGRFYRANYERGILLYALVARYCPKCILEFGTGRGYGSLCMAWAMEDHGITGRIYTVDVIPSDERFSWPIDWGDDRGAHVEQLSRSEVWPKAAPATWRARVETMTGFSGQAMNQYQGPRVDLAFIDGGHGYTAVRHDYYSVLQVAADRFGILFDDYAPKPGFGIQKLVDEEVIPWFQATLVYTDRRWPGGERAILADPGYGMAWIHTDHLAGTQSPVEGHATESGYLRDYRKREQFMRARRWLSRIRRRLMP